VNILSELRELGVEFISVREGLNFSGPLGLALYALVAALAEAEVEAMRERTIAGLRNARAKGRRRGGPPWGRPASSSSGP
jgi:DNA invertase Pin-like site-specific DNA recombinase